MNLLTKQKQTHRLREQTYSCPGEDIVREFGMDVYTWLYLKWITNSDLLYNTGDSAQCFVADWKGGEFGGKRMLVICMAESLCYSPETIKALLISYTLIWNKKIFKVLFFSVPLSIVQRNFKTTLSLNLPNESESHSVVSLCGSLFVTPWTVQSMEFSRPEYWSG